MKILVHRSKHVDNYWDASTPELQAWALRELFVILDRDWNAYDCIKSGNGLESLKSELDDLEQIRHKLDTDPSIHSFMRKSAERTLERIPEVKREIRVRTWEVELYSNAVAGDDLSLKYLLDSRRDYEYEGWSIEDVRTFGNET